MDIVAAAAQEELRALLWPLCQGLLPPCPFQCAAWRCWHYGILGLCVAGGSGSSPVSPLALRIHAWHACHGKEGMNHMRSTLVRH